MISTEWFRDKKVTVMGLGLHGGGLGTSKWLLTLGAQVTVTDLKDQHALVGPIADLERHYYKESRRLGKRNIHRVRYVLGKHEEKDFSGADMIFQNPGVPRESPLLEIARNHQVPIEADISIFFLLCPFPVTAVTGTKGKTTTTTLLAEICKAHDKRTVVGGNIRISALGALDRLLALAKKRAAAPPVVLELSSWQLESLEKHGVSPHIGVITNIKEDHLNRYRDMDDYAHAKEMNVAFQSPDDFAILNACDERTVAMGKRTKGRVYWFSWAPSDEKYGCFLKGKDVVFRDGGKEKKLFAKNDIKLPGEHNIGNILAAVAAARLMGVPASTIRKTVRAFKGVAGRLEDVATKKGVRFINDTTATAPDAAVAALKTLGTKKKKIILISGGADKNLHFDEWAAEVAATVKHLILFDGSATPKMEAALASIGAKVSMRGARSMREALGEAKLHAKKGDIVLLSPGCASFGLFQHEFDRGDQFVKLVKRIR